MWNSKQIADCVKGELLGNVQVLASKAVIDSRQVEGGEIFFAFPGVTVDGHEYIEKAWEKGASLVIAEREKLSQRLEVNVPEGKALVIVESSLTAMQVLAKAWRHKLQAKVVGITGSNGKTTTKDMVGAVLGEKYKVHKNKENQNNEIGLPMTILNAPEDTEILILEMGMRGLGQIKELCSIAEPNFGVITNIGTTHMELLGSQENIAKAKWELIDCLPKDGAAIINAEDFWSVEKSKRDRHKAYFYGIVGKYHTPDLQAQNLVQAGVLGTSFEVGAGEIRAQLPLPGEHNVLDALAALQVGLCLGLTLEESCRGLEKMELSPMRLELHSGIYNSSILSDVYNANPTSMQASLKILRERGGDVTLAMLGEMYELGEASEQGHYDVGCEVAKLGITELITVGALAKEIAKGACDFGMSEERIHQCNTREEAITTAKKVLAKVSGAWVLIKASRGMKMEEVTKALQKG